MVSKVNRSGGNSGKYLAALALGAVALGLGLGASHARRASAQDASAQAPGDAYVTARSPEHAGRYLVVTAGCNDCHTPGWMQQGASVPEEQWLTGVPVGWRGPWGTTYASNLRVFLQDFSEDLFVQTIRSRNSRPPMPWMNLHGMSDADLRAIYRYIRSLPLKGEKMPEYCPPGVEPKTPFRSMEPTMPATR